MIAAQIINESIESCFILSFQVRFLAQEPRESLLAQFFLQAYNCSKFLLRSYLLVFRNVDALLSLYISFPEAYRFIRNAISIIIDAHNSNSTNYLSYNVVYQIIASFISLLFNTCLLVSSVPRKKMIQQSYHFQSFPKILLLRAFA